MKLKSLTLENFKQYKGKNKITFNSEGKMTIIYGFNGFGKSRLHSSFHWVLYGEDRDNEIIYNNQAIEKLFDNDLHTVSGTLEFSHNKTHYTLYRTQDFRKKGNVLRFEDANLALRYIDGKGNHAPQSEPQKFINQIFPSELSPYFLFDGEGMTNELLHGKKVTKFSKSLKDAVNQLFGLGIYENAIRDLGSDNKKLGVIGELHSLKVNDKSDYSVDTLRSVIYSKTKYKEELEDKNDKLEVESTELENQIKILSEQIGKSENPKEIEDRNKLIQKRIESRKLSKLNHFDRFGKSITNKYLHNLIAGRAYNIPNLSDEYYVENSNQYISRNLINEILTTNLCVCGEEIDPKRKIHLSQLLNTLPPVSFKHNYTRLKNNAVRRVDEIPSIVKELDSMDRELILLQEELYELKKEYDQNLEKLKEFDSIGILVSKREEAETKLKSVNEKYRTNERLISENNSQIEGAKSRLKRAEKSSEHNKRIQDKIDFIKDLKEQIEKEFEERKRSQKQVLEDSIKDLIQKMLNAKRDIYLNDDFTMTIKTMDKKESMLSAGQSAVISFSYIGGVLKALKSLDYDFISKEYPLILDAPLSHLDKEHIKRVFKYLPDFADQLVIFSKEDIGKEISNFSEITYEIRSNDYKNISSLHEYQGKDYFTSESRRMIDGN